MRRLLIGLPLALALVAPIAGCSIDKVVAPIASVLGIEKPLAAQIEDLQIRRNALQKATIANATEVSVYEADAIMDRLDQLNGSILGARVTLQLGDEATARLAILAADQQLDGIEADFDKLYPGAR